MILKWYKIDFGANNTEVIENRAPSLIYQIIHLLSFLSQSILQLLGWIADHLPDGPKKQQLKELVEQPRNVKVKFRTYNWDLNS